MSQSFITLLSHIEQILTSGSKSATLAANSKSGTFKIPTSYHNYKVKIAEYTKDTGKNDKGWVGIWDFDPQLNGTIYLEKQYADGLKRNHDKKSLNETLKHELLEANLAKEKVIKAHGPLELIPFDKRKKLLDHAGAETHHDAIAAMHPTWTEDEYLAELDEEKARLHVKDN